MIVDYDQEANVLTMITGELSATSASLLCDPGIVVDLTESEGHDIVGVLVMGASAYLPLKKGYDPKTDTLLLGKRVESPDLITETGDFVGFWHVHCGEPGGFMDPVGVLIRDASKHLASVCASSAV